MSGSETPGFSYSKAKKRRTSMGGSKAPQSNPNVKHSAKKRTLDFVEAPSPDRRSIPIKEVAALKKGGQEAPPTPGFHFQKKGGKSKPAAKSAPTPSKKTEASPKKKPEAAGKNKRRKSTATSNEPEKQETKPASPKKATTPEPAAAESGATKRKSPEKPAEDKSAKSKKTETAFPNKFDNLRNLLLAAISAELGALPERDSYAEYLRQATEAFLKEVDADPSLLQVFTAAEATKLRSAPAKNIRLPNPKNDVLKRKEEIYAKRLRELKTEEEQWQRSKAHYTALQRQSVAQRPAPSPVKLTKEEKGLLELQVQSPRKGPAAPSAAELFQSLALNVDDANRTARELEHLRATADDFFTRLAGQVHKQRFKAADARSLLSQVARV